MLSRGNGEESRVRPFAALRVTQPVRFRDGLYASFGRHSKFPFSGRSLLWIFYRRAGALAVRT